MPEQLDPSSVPTGNTPLKDPASLGTDRDLKVEKDKEMATEKAKASAKLPRFEVKPRISTKPPAPESPEFETLIYKAAANAPIPRLTYPMYSGYVPNTSIIFYVLNYMDYLMTSTDKWTRNSGGWVSPISQMYVGILTYIQIIRATIASGIASHAMISWFTSFCTLFPLKELWIPGPLVSAFKALSAFEPTEDLSLGVVSAMLPNTPGWSPNQNAGRYILANNYSLYLPSIAMFIDRYHQLLGVARSANITEQLFFNHTNGPLYRSTLFNQSIHATPVAAQNSLKTPGAGFVTPGTLQQWQSANRHAPLLGIPSAPDLSVPDTLADTWDSAMFLDQTHQWFGNIAAIMAKYSQFWNGSASLDSCSPSSSAAAALKLRLNPPAQGNSLFGDKTLTVRAGNGSSTQHGDPDADAHAQLFANASIRFNSKCALKDYPELFSYAGSTWAINGYTTTVHTTANRTGPFWDLGPDWYADDNVELIPGILPTIMREYHNDVRIPATKQ